MVYSPEECTETYSFKDIFEETPERLRAAGLYGPLVLQWWRYPAFTEVSLRLVAKALGAHLKRPDYTMRRCCDNMRAFQRTVQQRSGVLAVDSYYEGEEWLRGWMPRERRDWLLAPIRKRVPRRDTRPPDAIVKRSVWPRSEESRCAILEAPRRADCDPGNPQIRDDEAE